MGLKVEAKKYQWKYVATIYLLEQAGAELCQAQVKLRLV